MKILFIYQVKEFPTFNKPLLNQMEIPLGISYISSLLKKNGHETKCLVLQKIRNKELKNIIKFKPELICFSSISSNYNKVRETSRIIKKYLPKTPHLIGGQHVSMNCDTLLENSEFDYLCIGEGEETTLELVNNLTNKKNKKIKGLWVKNKNKIIKNPKRKFINKLDSLPLPDREMWKEYVYNYDSSPTIILGRGCPFDCTYCSNSSLKNSGIGTYFRIRNIDSIISEIKFLLRGSNKIKAIRFEFDTLSGNIKFIKQLCFKLYILNNELETKISFSGNLRIVESLDYDDLFSHMSMANFRNIRIGVETGSELYRRKYLKRFETNYKIIEAVKKAKKNNINVYVYLMFGLPDENISDYYETISLIKKLKVKGIYKNFFYPIPGTKLFDYCKKKNYLKENVRETLEPALKNQKLSYFKCIFNYVLFEFRVTQKKMRSLKATLDNIFIVIYPLSLFKKYLKSLFWFLTRSKLKSDEFS